MSFLKDLLAVRQAKQEPITEAQDDLDVDDLWDKYIDARKMYSFEGTRGLRHLEKAAGELFNYDSLTDFLADNPAIIEHAFEHIREMLDHDEDAIERLGDIVGVSDEMDSDPLDIISKIADDSGLPKADIHDIFLGGGRNVSDTLAKLEAEGYDTGGGWEENEDWFLERGITKKMYQVLVDASS